MFGSAARASSAPALPRLGEIRLPGEKPEAQRKAAAELVVAATELKRGSNAQVDATVLAVGVIALVDELLEHNLAPYRAKLTDAAHFGELLARVDRAPEGRMSPAAAAVLCYVGAQFDHEDKLFEQLCRWSLEAGYYATRTGTAADELLAGLRLDMAKILRSFQIPRPRNVASGSERPVEHCADISPIPRPRLRSAARR
jgi:hypothetical protein